MPEGEPQQDLQREELYSQVGEKIERLNEILSGVDREIKTVLADMKTLGKTLDECAEILSDRHITTYLEYEGLSKKLDWLNSKKQFNEQIVGKLQAFDEEAIKLATSLSEK